MRPRFARQLRPSLPLSTRLFASRWVGFAIGAYALLVLVASLHFNISLTPDRLIPLFLIAAFATGRVRLFLKDWSVFFVVVLAWQVLQGFTPHFLHQRPHVSEMIDADKLLFFGQVPTIWLQRHFYHPGAISWYDAASALLYLMHFLLPLSVAFALWHWWRDVFRQFMLSFLFLALAGFSTYVLFPAAPPWIASKWHYLPHVTKIFDVVVGPNQSFSMFYQWMWQHGGWDQFGAVPSEHAALPFLCFLWARRAWPRLSWLLLAYSLCVCLAVVYLGEHYVFDAIVGFGYAALAYAGIRVAGVRMAKSEPAAVIPVGPTPSPQPVSDQIPA